MKSPKVLTSTSAPEIIRKLNLGSKQFGPVSQDADIMQVPDKMQEVPVAIYELLTAAEQALLEKTKDIKPT